MRNPTPKPLSPLTLETYNKILTRAFGSHEPGRFKIPPGGFGDWTESSKLMLRAAISRKVKERQLSEVDGEGLFMLAPLSYTNKLVVEGPSEDELLRFEAEAEKLPKGKRALVLLPLALGLRSRELLNLTRKSVLRALETGEMKILRKRGKEALIPVGNVHQLLQDLLNAPKNQHKLNQRNSKPWEYVREILSVNEYITAYHLFHRLIRKLGKDAGIDNLRPHLLRHGFATRMEKDGATITEIKEILGHEDINTTMRYVHVDMKEAARHTRNWNR